MGMFHDVGYNQGFLTIICTCTPTFGMLLRGRVDGKSTFR